MTVEKIDLQYYKTVATTQDESHILKAELNDLINEVEQLVDVIHHWWEDNKRNVIQGIHEDYPMYEEPPLFVKLVKDNPPPKPISVANLPKSFIIDEPSDPDWLRTLPTESLVAIILKLKEAYEE